MHINSFFLIGLSFLTPFRNKKVILDRDLAELYGVKPIRLREQVKRNIKFVFEVIKQLLNPPLPPEKPKKKIGFKAEGK